MTTTEQTAIVWKDGDPIPDWGPGTVIAVHYGDYRNQEIWVASGAHVGNWLCLGGEFGRPKIVEDDRNALEKMSGRIRWVQPEGTIPLWPDLRDILRRGPVTRLVAADRETYVAGWRDGRRQLVSEMDEAAYEGPANVSAAPSGEVG